MTEFEKRKQEIQTYINFLVCTEEDNNILKDALHDEDDPRLLRKILLANTYLLMYNLVESSVKNALQGIYEHLRNEETLFDNLKSSLRILILNNVKSQSPSHFLRNVQTLATDIVYQSFDPKKVAPGSIDARKIGDIATKYGFSKDTTYKKCKNGNTLVEVKDKRNDLAHGTISFAECGQETTVNDIKTAFSELSAYLGEIILNIEKYIDDQQYLQPRDELEEEAEN